MGGKINIDVSFPIISMTNNDVQVFQQVVDYAICRKKSIEKLKKLNEQILDSTGILYKRGDIFPLKRVNFFGGFSLKFASFGVWYVEKEFIKLKLLTDEELKIQGRDVLRKKAKLFEGTTLNIKKWAKEFEGLTERDDLLRYLFYFAGPSYYHTPDISDRQWRSRRGFDKKLKYDPVLNQLD
jgi:hypothetical protein